MKEIICYTDGGCRGNGASNNIGSYAYYLNYKGHIKTFSEGFRNVTNNQMELLAAIKALKALKEPCKVRLHSDSAYVVNAVNEKWINGWKRSNWIRRSGNKEFELANKELWQELYECLQEHDVEFIKVKGHSDDELNNLVDKLLNEEMDKMEN